MHIITYTDIDLNLTKKKNGDIKELISVDAIKSSIENIITTLKGDRRMLPDFAMDLWQYLFEPMDEVTANSIGEELVTVIEKWDSRVIIENIYIEPIYERNLYRVVVSFNLRNLKQEETEQIETILQRG